MKANQKFLRADDAVSPVIAVILMVAITVVLAATVYVWVSGFGAQSGNPQKSISLTSGGAQQSNSTAVWKNYTAASASSGMKWSDVSISLNGGALSCKATENATAGGGGANTQTFRIWSGGSVSACGSSSSPPPNVINAGDVIEIFNDGTTSMAGKTLRLVDSQANAVMLTLTVG